MTKVIIGNTIRDISAEFGSEWQVNSNDDIIKLHLKTCRLHIKCDRIQWMSEMYIMCCGCVRWLWKKIRDLIEGRTDRSSPSRCGGQSRHHPSAPFCMIFAWNADTSIEWLHGACSYINIHINIYVYTYFLWKNIFLRSSSKHNLFLYYYSA